MRPEQDSARVGDTPCLPKTITETHAVLFAGIACAFNPLHVDQKHAKNTRFGGRIARGLLATGLVSAVLGTQLPGPGSIYLSQRLEFLSPVRLGDTITAAFEIIDCSREKRIVALRTGCHNQDIAQVLDGEAVLLLGKA